EPRGAADAVELSLFDTCLEQALTTALLVAARAERADVVRLRGKRAHEERKVELVVVGEDDDRRRVIRLDLGERLFRPGDDHLVWIRQPLVRREAASRVGAGRAPADPARR